MSHLDDTLIVGKHPEDRLSNHVVRKRSHVKREMFFMWNHLELR